MNFLSVKLNTDLKLWYVNLQKQAVKFLTDLTPFGVQPVKKLNSPYLEVYKPQFEVCIIWEMALYGVTIVNRVHMIYLCSKFLGNIFNSVQETKIRKLSSFEIILAKTVNRVGHVKNWTVQCVPKVTTFRMHCMA